jgi:branched-chain amino acid transport system permease protein
MKSSDQEGVSSWQAGLSSGSDIRPAMWFIGLGLLLAVAPLLAFPSFLMKVLCFAIFAGSFNLLLGYSGLMSFGQAAFFGTASYVCAYGLKHWNFSPEMAMLSATMVAALLGFVFGAIAIRREGIYFAMVTLALAQLVYFVCVQTPGFTGGEDGIQAVPRGALFGRIDLHSDQRLYYFSALIFLVCLAFTYRVINSPFGEVLKAIRENEGRATSLGYKTAHYKLIAFTIAAGLAGLAGALKAVAFQSATLTDVHWTMSGEPVLMTIVGGLGSLCGPLVGALVLISVETYLVELGAWVLAIQGTLFVVCVMVFQGGVLGTILPMRRP